VEYLKGKTAKCIVKKNNKGSRNKKILKVTTRIQGKQENLCAGKEEVDLQRQALNKASRPNLFKYL